nr:hypothetical protein [Paenibacillus larvae]
MKTYKHRRFEEYQLYYMLMYFLSQTGLRISEALALKWTDIEGNKLTVERQTSRDDNKSENNLLEKMRMDHISKLSGELFNTFYSSRFDKGQL